MAENKRPHARSVQDRRPCACLHDGHAADRNPRHAPTYSFTHEELIKTLDANGVDRAVIAAASPWGDYNDHMMTALRAYGRRLRANAIFRRPMERFELEAMSREGFCRHPVALHRPADAA